MTALEKKALCRGLSNLDLVIQMPKLPKMSKMPKVKVFCLFVYSLTSNFMFAILWLIFKKQF